MRNVDLVYKGYLNMGVYRRLEFDDINMLIYYLGHNCYVSGEFDFLCNSISIYDVIYDYTTTSEDTLL